MESKLALGIAIGVVIGLTITLVTIHVYKPDAEAAAVAYVLDYERQQLPAGAVSATIVESSRALVTGAVHAAFERIPL